MQNSNLLSGVLVLNSECFDRAIIAQDFAIDEIHSSAVITATTLTALTWNITGRCDLDRSILAPRSVRITDPRGRDRRQISHRSTHNSKSPVLQVINIPGQSTMSAPHLHCQIVYHDPRLTAKRQPETAIEAVTRSGS